MYLPSSQDSRDEFSEDVSTFAPVCEESDKDEAVHIYFPLSMHMLLMYVFRIARMRKS